MFKRCNSPLRCNLIDEVLIIRCGETETMGENTTDPSVNRYPSFSREMCRSRLSCYWQQREPQIFRQSHFRSEIGTASPITR